MSEAFLKYDEKNPPAGVGRDGVMRYDLIIDYLEDFKNAPSSSPLVTQILNCGDFSSLKAKVRAGVPVSGFVKHQRFELDGSKPSSVCALTGVGFVDSPTGGEFVFAETLLDGAFYKFGIYPNNSLELL